MAKEKEKAIVPTQSDLDQRALAIQADAQARAQELRDLGIDAKDLVIPLIQVMQNTSELVGEEKAKLGELVNMSTEEILGGIDKPIQILPLKAYKTLRTYDVSEGFKFMKEEPLNAVNDKLQGEGMVDGVPVKHYSTFNFFVLLKTDLQKGEAFPCLIRFRSTGMNAGRALATHLYKLVFFRKKPYSIFVELSTKKEKKDTNYYAIPVIDAKKQIKASAEEMQEAENWLAMLAAGNYKLDDREDISGDMERGSTSAKPTVVEGEVLGKDDGEY